MRFLLSVDMGNEAMRTRQDVAKALRAAAEKVVANSTSVPLNAESSSIFDDNGNRVGNWEFVGKLIEEEDFLDPDEDHLESEPDEDYP